MAAGISPDKGTVARRLDADAEQLEMFVTNHPDPSADVVLRSSVTPKAPEQIAAETRDRLAVWIADRKQRQRDGPRRRILEYLDEHGPAHFDVVLDAVTGPDTTRPAPVMGALHALEVGGHIETVDGGPVYQLTDERGE